MEDTSEGLMALFDHTSQVSWHFILFLPGAIFKTDLLTSYFLLYTVETKDLFNVTPRGIFRFINFDKNQSGLKFAKVTEYFKTTKKDRNGTWTDWAKHSLTPSSSRHTNLHCTAFRLLQKERAATSQILQLNCRLFAEWNFFNPWLIMRVQRISIGKSCEKRLRKNAKKKNK